MDSYETNERFRELCYVGDLELVKKYFDQSTPDVNSQNKINGWYIKRFTFIFSGSKFYSNQGQPCTGLLARTTFQLSNSSLRKELISILQIRRDKNLESKLEMLN